MALKFEEFVALPKSVQAVELNEKLWRSLRRNGGVEVGDNTLTAYELDKKKLFMFGSSDDILSDCTNLQLGEWIVLNEGSIFLYTKDEFNKLFRRI